jgi:hypothetical protein
MSYYLFYYGYYICFVALIIAGSISTYLYGLHFISILCWIGTISLYMYKRLIIKLNEIISVNNRIFDLLRQIDSDVHRSHGDLDFKIRHIEHMTESMYVAHKKLHDKKYPEY